MARKRVALFYMRVCSAARGQEPECISAQRATNLLIRTGEDTSRRDTYWFFYELAMHDAERQILCRHEEHGHWGEHCYIERGPCSRCPHPVNALREHLKVERLNLEQVEQEGRRDGVQEQLRNVQHILRT